MLVPWGLRIHHNFDHFSSKRHQIVDPLVVAAGLADLGDKSREGPGDPRVQSCSVHHRVRKQESDLSRKVEVQLSSAAAAQNSVGVDEAEREEAVRDHYVTLVLAHLAQVVAVEQRGERVVVLQFSSLEEDVLFHCASRLLEVNALVNLLYLKKHKKAIVTGTNKL